MSEKFDEIVKISDESQSVIQMIQHSGCAPLEDGAFYRTFNDSLVFVALIHPKVDVEVKMPDFLKDMLGDKIDELMEARKKEAEEEAKSWRASILQGGHGIAEIIGERPGETYSLDKESMFDLGDKNKRYAQALSMSLRVKVCHLDTIKELKL